MYWSLWHSSVLFGISSRTVWLVERFQQLYLLMEKKKQFHDLSWRSQNIVKQLQTPQRPRNKLWSTVHKHVYTIAKRELFFTNKSAEIFRICISCSCLLLVLLWLNILEEFRKWEKYKWNPKQRDAKNWELHLCRHFRSYLYVN